MHGTHDLRSSFAACWGLCPVPRVVRTRAICRMSAFASAGMCCRAVTLSPTRLDYLSQVLLCRTTTEVPSADANAYERGQKTRAGDGSALYLGLELLLLLYYAPLFNMSRTLSRGNNRPGLTLRARPGLFIYRHPVCRPLSRVSVRRSSCCLISAHGAVALCIS